MRGIEPSPVCLDVDSLGVLAAMVETRVIWVKSRAKMASDAILAGKTTCACAETAVTSSGESFWVPSYDRRTMAQWV